MGRGRRKLKQCDPFNKKSRERSKVTKKKEIMYDLPPNRSLKRNSKSRKSRIPTQESIEAEVLGQSKVKKSNDISKILPGEKMKDFCKRINSQVRDIINQEAKKNMKQKIKQKKFFEKKKQKKKESRMSEQEKYELEREERDKMEFKGAEKIAFGDVAMRPPILPKLKILPKKKNKVQVIKSKR